MEQVMWGGVAAADLAEAVGGGSYARGVAYFHKGAVRRVWWDDSQSALAGTVSGSSGEAYSTTAFFSLIDGLAPQFEHGRCSCPMAFNCKHVVALIMAAAQAGPVPASARPCQEPASWEQSLDSLLEPSRAVSRGQASAIPIAIELTLAPAGRPGQVPGPAAVPPLRLLARLVQPGKNGGWINGSLSWQNLDSLNFQGNYVRQHVRLLQEMFAMYHSRSSRWVSYNSYSPDKSIDFSAFESSQLWPMLDQAEAVGLRLLYGRSLGTVGRYGSGELCLDVTGGGPSEPPGSLAVAPLIRVDGMSTGAQPLSFFGTEGHGLVYVDPAEAQRTADYVTWRFGLARLAKTVPPQLQRMAVAGQRLQVPEAQLSRFRSGYYPRLRQTATVISSDGSFTPPEISAPTLVLTACFGTGHDLDVSWAWEYQVGDSRERASLRADPADGYRDLDAERLVLGGLDLPLDRFGLLRSGPGVAGSALAGPEPDLAATARLGGIDTMRFSTELLPLAAGQPGVRVEVTGAPADYRAADDSLWIGVSADEVAGDRDWFDLGVTITAEGHQVPFTDLFLALSCGQSHLLLDDGAYFSLQKPELQALAALIEEARELQDAPPVSCGVSCGSADSRPACGTSSPTSPR